MAGKRGAAMAVLGLFLAGGTGYVSKDAVVQAIRANCPVQQEVANRIVADHKEITVSPQVALSWINKFCEPNVTGTSDKVTVELIKGK